MFSLCCNLRQCGANKITQGVQLKAKERFECPVTVKFKWNTDRMTYYRSRNLIMQHNHPLQIKDRSTIISSPEMLKDVELWTKCKVSVPNMVKLLNKKYKEAEARYQDVYGLVKQLTAQE